MGTNVNINYVEGLYLVMGPLDGGIFSRTHNYLLECGDGWNFLITRKDFGVRFSMLYYLDGGYKG